MPVRKGSGRYTKLVDTELTGKEITSGIRTQRRTDKFRMRPKRGTGAQEEEYSEFKKSVGRAGKGGLNNKVLDAFGFENIRNASPAQKRTMLNSVRELKNEYRGFAPMTPRAMGSFASLRADAPQYPLAAL